MPAGDLITGDNQLEIRATLLGAGTDWFIDEPGISGLDIDVKTQDVDRQHAAGVYTGRDYLAPLTILIPLKTVQDTAADAGALLATLRTTTWAISEAADIPLHLQLPGWGHIAVSGRPRGLLAKLDALPDGVVQVLLTFFAGDPTIATVP